MAATTDSGGLGGRRRTRRLVAAVAAVAAAAGALAATVALSGTVAAQEGATDHPPRLVILARSDNPVDALSSGPVGGVLGAPVLLTPRSGLHPAAAGALDAIDPDVVVLAGGHAALSEAVEEAVGALGYATRRAAGADRHETAVLVSALLAEFSTGRPVLTGTAVTDEVVPGLNAERLQGQTPGDLVAGLESRVAELEARAAELEARAAGLEGTLTGVSREVVDGHDTILLEGVNLQLVDGSGSTGGTPTGLGNLIIGYSQRRPFPPAEERTGSHYLVVGDRHDWTAHGGILAGFSNTASGIRASVLGGAGNEASGESSSVAGGTSNEAGDFGATVTGGQNNEASGTQSTVTGGSSSAATGHASSVSGGLNNTASGFNSSILGGSGNTTAGGATCHPGC